jgi:hypothetical protein
MTTIELEIKKAQLLKDIDSEELYNKVKQYIRQVKKESIILPNQYKSVEELTTSIDEAEKELRAGNGYTTADAKTKAKEWL